MNKIPARNVENQLAFTSEVMANINELHREVESWLQRIFGGESFPQYEVNMTTLNMLHELMKRNDKQDEYMQLVIEDLQQKTEEYRLEARRLGNTLAAVGITASSLSQSGNISLRTLSNLALLLQTRDASETSLLLGMSELTQQSLKLNDARQTEQRLCTDLFSKTKAALLRCNELKKALQSLEAQVKCEEAELEQKARQSGFIHSKVKEYKKNIQQQQLQLVRNGADPSIYHQTLVKRAEELQQLKGQLQPLKAKLQSYHNLPPDLPLAKVKTEEAKQEIARLEQELSSHIDVMHM